MCLHRPHDSQTHVVAEMDTAVLGGWSWSCLSLCAKSFSDVFITRAGGDEVRDRLVTEEDVLDLTMRHYTSKLEVT